jgi:DNA-binding NarL/FixJ family response regulator
MIRVLVADDHPIVRSGLTGLLEEEDDMTIVGEAADGAEAVARATALRPDVVLMDLRMPGLDGVGATQQITASLPSTRVLVLTTYDTDDDIVRAVEAGATGYLLKDTPQPVLVVPQPQGAGRCPQPSARRPGGRRCWPRRSPPNSSPGCGPRPR